LLVIGISVLDDVFKMPNTANNTHLINFLHTCLR
jgi:hypothetical protein